MKTEGLSKKDKILFDVEEHLKKARQLYDIANWHMEQAMVEIDFGKVMMQKEKMNRKK